MFFLAKDMIEKIREAEEKGAEIIKTIVGNELKEFLILGIIIILRALLSILIHWEITTEEKEERAHIILMEQARKSKEEKSEEKKDK